MNSTLYVYNAIHLFKKRALQPGAGWFLAIDTVRLFIKTHSVLIWCCKLSGKKTVSGLPYKGTSWTPERELHQGGAGRTIRVENLAGWCKCLW